MSLSAEQLRLIEADRKEKHWRRWGPYVSARQWGTVREDYSENGTAWDYFPHDHARSRAYRWGEDGIFGFCDNHQRLCIAPAFWNGRDPILKERFFGLNGNEGNHAEDVKEIYYYLDGLPTHSYMKALYKYPQAAFPYGDLVQINGRRSKQEPEYELIDTGVFGQNRYFDIFVEYAKADVDDILMRFTIVNRGPEPAQIHLLPTVWLRNTWSWSHGAPKPLLDQVSMSRVRIDEPSLGSFEMEFEGRPDLLFTENATNTERLWGYSGDSRFYKDAFHEYIIHGRKAAVNSLSNGTRMCAVYDLKVDSGGACIVRARLGRRGAALNLTDEFDSLFALRLREADEFYELLASKTLSADARMVQRQAFAGMLWNKQFFYFDVDRWLKGDPAGPPPPAEHRLGRNSDWVHLFNEDILSMPDNWEYPWYAAWDTAFHMLPLAMIDPGYAKQHLSVFLREWYMHPNGQIPAYEWAFGDVNPPVHAWSCWRVYKMDRKTTGKSDHAFLESVFHKLLMNFTWWVNRKDSHGNNIFEGGFLGLDNIGVFDRSKPLPTGGHLEQSDATSWMAMYCLNMMKIALELATVNIVYEDVASKFFEHFLYIAHAMNLTGSGGLWNEEDGFYYDRIRWDANRTATLRIRSVVGIIPLFAVDTIEPWVPSQFPSFARRMKWFVDNRPDLCESIGCIHLDGTDQRHLMSIVPASRLKSILNHLLDEAEFLSPFGIRSLSRYHRDHPFSLRVDGVEHRVDYDPAESTTYVFGGNSNWRGPVWFPINYTLIESLQRFHRYFGDSFRVECPTGSGVYMNLDEVAAEISRRLSRLFLRDDTGRRAAFGANPKFHEDPHFRDHILFYEYFHGDNGAGLGASHQTGWTGLVAKLLQQSGE